MFRHFPSRSCAFLLGLACSLSGAAAHALERVTLTSGFSLDCTHYEQVGNNVRLYKSADDTNYQDIPAARVASIDRLPDPPAPPEKTAAAKPAESANHVPTAEEIKTFLATAGAAHHIDVELLASVIKAESNFHVDAVSRAGARGLMQLMPATAHDLGVQDVKRADQNIYGGAAYLDSLLKRYKDDLPKALAAYNAGPAVVDRYHGVPPYRETQWYVYRVISEFNRRMEARAATAVASR